MDAKNKPIIYALIGIIICIYAFLLAISHPALLGLALESSFELAPESRLPHWFSIPPGYGRKDLTVKIYYYSPPPPFGTYNLKAELLGPPPVHKVLERKVGKQRWHPYSERRGYQSYPSYMIESVNGIEEVVEHKKMEPLFYISDDSNLVDEMKRSK